MANKRFRLGFPDPKTVILSMLSSLVVTIAFTGGFHVGRCVNVVSFSRANVPVPSRTDGRAVDVVGGGKVLGGGGPASWLVEGDGNKFCN